MDTIDVKPFSMTSSERINFNKEIYGFLVPIMNRIHSSNFSDRFWKILLQKYVTMINSRKKLFIEDQISSKAEFEALNSFSKPKLNEKTILFLKTFIKSIKSFGNEKIINSILQQKDNIAFGFHDPSSLKEDIPAYLPVNYKITFSWPNKLKRKLAYQIADEQNELFYRNIIRLIPKSLIEYFDYYYNSIPSYSPHTKIFNVSMIESLYMRFLLAKYIGNGSRLFYYQHGAFYGEYQFYSPYEFEYDISDKYFTWGWEKDEKNVPWKAYRLNKFERNYKRIIPDKQFDCLIVFPQVNLNNLNQFKQSTLHLINNLSIDKYKRILVRPRPSAKDLNYKAQFNFINDKRVLIDSGKSVIGEIISKSRIVVQFNYPSTNLLECLYVDHPSVVILNNSDPTSLVKPFYEYFVDKGIFHYNFETLTNHLNKIEVSEWWKEITTDPIYISFKNHFLRKSI